MVAMTDPRFKNGMLDLEHTVLREQFPNPLMTARITAHEDFLATKQTCAWRL